MLVNNSKISFLRIVCSELFQQTPYLPFHPKISAWSQVGAEDGRGSIVSGQSLSHWLSCAWLLYGVPLLVLPAALRRGSEEPSGRGLRLLGRVSINQTPNSKSFHPSPSVCYLALPKLFFLPFRKHFDSSPSVISRILHKKQSKWRVSLFFFKFESTRKLCCLRACAGGEEGRHQGGG